MEGAACGEVADEESLNAGHADGQCLEVSAEAGEIAADVGGASLSVGREAVDVGARFLPEALDIGTYPRAEASDIGSAIFLQALDFGSKGEDVTTRLLRLRHYQGDPNDANGQGCDESC